MPTPSRWGARSSATARFNASLMSTIGPGVFLLYRAIALGLHTTTLILVNGALDARGSKLSCANLGSGASRLGPTSSLSRTSETGS
ncbi:hypothetical protein KC218_23380, partial [Mycobacterium tuberculosis]|nr:hypothetical protein [Mycobacterium tuberculosis]